MASGRGFCTDVWMNLRSRAREVISEWTAIPRDGSKYRERRQRPLARTPQVPQALPAKPRFALGSEDPVDILEELEGSRVRESGRPTFLREAPDTPARTA
jgi:hypothetical protein